jgi:hypothetical protein
MFTIAQHIIKMETIKNTLRFLSIVIIIASMTACSSTSTLPNDDVYYSSKTKKASQYDWDDFQKNAQAHSDNNVTPTSENEYTSNYSSTPEAGVIEEQSQSDDYEFIDEYYDSDYASRISRFNGSGTSDDYYDDGYTSNCCNGGSNVSMSFGMGVGMGYGWSMGYGYGWPHYGWGYPSYGWGYPYYGGSYWSGYNNGYSNGYWDGYYNGGGYYPGGGGYYPDYGYTASYAPRGKGGRGSGGTNIPRSSNGRSGYASNKSTNGDVKKENRVSRSNYVVPKDVSSKKYTNTRSGSTGSPTSKGTRTEISKANTDTKGVSPKTKLNAKPRSNTQSYPAKSKIAKPTSSKTDSRGTPKYQKPKTYESLPSRQPRSSKEYVRPNNSNTTNTRNSSTYNRSVKQNNVRTNNSSSTRTKAAPQRKTNTSSRTVSTPKSYNSPTRSSKSSKSYSSPSKSYSAPSKSSSSGSSRSSSSGGRSTSSGTKSGGGRR